VISLDGQLGFFTSWQSDLDDLYLPLKTHIYSIQP